MGSYFSRCCKCNKVLDWLQQDNKWILVLWAVGGALALLYTFHGGACLVENSYPCCKRTQREEPEDPETDEESEDFDYGMSHGPHSWRTAENNQSPINIDSRAAERICFDAPLLWLGYEELPVGVRLENNGHTLLLRLSYAGGTPYMAGGDLVGCFGFHEISFRWSWYNGTGSEHTLDHAHFPLEMQCLHTDTAHPEHASSRGLLVVSYMFAVSAENPFLDVIVQHLVAVQLAGQVVEIPPFPLNYLMPAFSTNFYSYHGSLTEPPCHRGAEWFLSPLPIAIGERQLHEFRKLRSRSGARIGRNARPVQELGDRIVQLNCFESAN